MARASVPPDVERQLTRAIGVDPESLGPGYILRAVTARMKAVELVTV